MKFIKEFGRNPHIDWLSIVAVSVVAVILLAFTGYTLYNAVVAGEIKGKKAKPTSSFVKVDDKLISSVFDRFEAREEMTKKVQAGYTAPADPSM